MDPSSADLASPTAGPGSFPSPGTEPLDFAVPVAALPVAAVASAVLFVRAVVGPAVSAVRACSAAPGSSAGSIVSASTGSGLPVCGVSGVPVVSVVLMAASAFANDRRPPPCIRTPPDPQSPYDKPPSPPSGRSGEQSLPGFRARNAVRA